MARGLILDPSEGVVHQFWRCHNREFYLASPRDRNLYFDCMRRGLDHVGRENVQVFAFCCMDNHMHQITQYTGGLPQYSTFMRYTHGIFGAKYNRWHGRSGKVAEGRPKTPKIQDDEHLIRAHFYVEANPIRANLCRIENLRQVKHCSYRYFAFGEIDELTRLLSIPDWYLNLGATMRERQRKYRKMFREYVESVMATVKWGPYFWGTACWIQRQYDLLKKKNLNSTQVEIPFLPNSS